MVSVASFLSGVQAIVDAQPAYKLGRSGVDGYCDCIGLIIGALRRAGGQWTGTHGSNYAARHQMQGLQLGVNPEPGLIVYKGRAPDTAGYALPMTYDRHADQTDYYHVGVVTSVSPLRITHCTSWTDGGGIKVDTRIGQWRFSGRLKGIDYEGSGSDTARVEQRMIVVAKSGSVVRMRSAPTGLAAIIINVPIGSMVDVLERRTDWSRIIHEGKSGWMMSEFLRAEAEPALPAGETAAKLEQAIALLQSALMDVRGG